MFTLFTGCCLAPPTAEWSEWSECTESCGGGTRFRTRQCGEASANCVVDSEDCNTQDCDPEPQIRGAFMAFGNKLSDVFVVSSPQVLVMLVASMSLFSVMLFVSWKGPLLIC